MPSVPVWFKVIAIATPGHDLPVGVVGMHGSESTSAGVTWTSPANATVQISGGVWLARDIGRSMDWALKLNGVTFTDGSLTTGDPFDSSNPFPFAAGSGGPSTLNFPVSIGDVITLELVKTSAFADFVGINFSINTSIDCNGNGIPDECDISGGASLDCNANGVPDECDIGANPTRTQIIGLVAHAWPNERVSDNQPPLSVDGDINTFTWSTESGNTAQPSFLGVSFGSISLLSSIRLWKDNNGGGGANVKDLSIQYTADAVPDLSAGTWQNVSGMVNGFGGTELMQATSVNADGTVIGDIHDSVNAGHGWASLTFNAVLATGVRIAFSTGGGFNHYKVHEFQTYHIDSVQDCNGNGIPDECDIAIGSSNDVNTNGIPDECEIVATRVYTHGPGVDEPLALRDLGASESFFYHADHLGSIRVMTDINGVVVQRYRYSSFGIRTENLAPAFVQPYSYTAREFDYESQLLFYRARTLDAPSGRFLQVDPIRAFAVNPFENGYTYVTNNAVNKRDPTGEVLKDLADIIGGFVDLVLTFQREEKKLNRELLEIANRNQPLIEALTGRQFEDLTDEEKIGIVRTLPGTFGAAKDLLECESAIVQSGADIIAGASKTRFHP